MKRISQKLKKNLFLLFIISINIFLTYFLYLSGTALERFYKEQSYSEQLPIITNLCFNFRYWPLLMIFVYFVKFNRHSGSHSKDYYFTVFVLEFILVVIYFVAYLYPFIFYSSVRLLQ